MRVIAFDGDEQTNVWPVDIDAIIERGVRDGMAGQRPKSEHFAYFDGWQRGERAHRACQRLLVVIFTPGTQCTRCDCSCPGYAEGCGGPGCQNAPVRYGCMCLYGPQAADEALVFLSSVELRQLAVEGMPIVDQEGESMVPNVLIQ